jgi:hypothetical protein
MGMIASCKLPLSNGYASLFGMVVGEQTPVGTVFIASAAASQRGWSSYPPEIIGVGGRDEDGPYGSIHPGCKNMMRTPFQPERGNLLYTAITL